MPEIATTKLHIGAHYYLPGDAVPPEQDVLEDYAELRRSGAIVEGEPESDSPRGDVTKVRAHIRLEKYDGPDADARALDPDIAADEVIEREDNLLTIGGGSALLERFIGTSITAFDNANAHIGVGDSTTAAADTQTDLQAVSNKLRKGMNVGYPSHTDSTSVSGAKTGTWQATFGTTEANWAWNEWGLFNALSSGRMANRKVESLGTKPGTQAWQITISWATA